jgi:hypothetical protein
VTGTVRFLGASSMWAWQFAKLQTAPLLNGLPPFAAMQDQYNLLKREEEREMLPMCADQDVGVVPYSPQAPGPADPAPGLPDHPRGRRRGRQGLRLPRRSADHRGDRGGRPRPRLELLPARTQPQLTTSDVPLLCGSSGSSRDLIAHPSSTVVLPRRGCHVLCALQG